MGNNVINGLGAGKQPDRANTKIRVMEKKTVICNYGMIDGTSGNFKDGFRNCNGRSGLENRSENC